MPGNVLLRDQEPGINDGTVRINMQMSDEFQLAPHLHTQRPNSAVAAIVDSFDQLLQNRRLAQESVLLVKPWRATAADGPFQTIKSRRPIHNESIMHGHAILVDTGCNRGGAEERCQLVVAPTVCMMWLYRAAHNISRR